MNRRKRLLMLSLAVPALLCGLFLLLPKTNCCDKRDVELEALNDRAFAGDPQAIKALHAKVSASGIEPLEEYWALQGALAGDEALRRAYVEIYQTRFDAARQQRAVERIKAQSGNPGAACLLRSLAGTLAASDPCGKP